MTYKVHITSDNYSIFIDVEELSLNEVLRCLEEQYGLKYSYERVNK